MHITIVTALYNIQRDSFKEWGRDWNIYLNWFKNCLSLKCRMIIFVEEDMKSFVEENRKKSDPNLDETFIKICKLEDSPYYRYKDKMLEVMQSPQFKDGLKWKDVPEYNYPLYNIVTYSKLFFMREASKINPFQSDYFLWVDAGCMHNNFPPHYYGSEFPNTNKLTRLTQDKIYITCRSTPQSSDLNLNTFLKSHTNRFAAFVIGSNVENINFMDDFLHAFLRDILNNNLIDCEQSALAICYLKNPEKFNLFSGEWYDGFRNLI